MDSANDMALRKLLLSLVPIDGSNIGNITLRIRLAEAAKQNGLVFDVGSYFRIRQPLIADKILGTGSGKGGSVFLVQLPEGSHHLEEGSSGGSLTGEIKLYSAVSETISAFWPADHGLDNCIIQVTGLQGKRATGGRWTRPDLALVSVCRHEYVPGVVLEVTTFEIKDTDKFDVTGVFEAAAHSAFAHKSYLAIKVANGASGSSDLERVRQECRRFGIGLLLFNDPYNRDTFDVQIESKNHTPSPSAVNRFISTQISEQNRARIRSWIEL